jgi:hypothetical protein
MDNLCVHTSGWVRELIEQRRTEGLPTVAPAQLLAGDEPHREEAFSKVKALLRKAKARTLAALFEATAWALGAVSARDARGYFEHRGYRTPQDHSL